MAVQGDLVYKDQDEIVAELLAAWQTVFPDASVGPDAIIRIISVIFGGSASGLYLGMQLLHDDMFIQTMSALALLRKGEELGRPQKAGLPSTGTVRFSGAGGTYIGLGAQVAAPRPSLDDTLLFDTTEDGTIPNPGVPDAPVASDGGAAGVLTGTYEYAISFTTAEGETEIGDPSNALVLVARKANLDTIPIGGPGTTGRNIYRRVNGGNWTFLHALADNVTVIYHGDNAADPLVGASPLADSTAERLTLAAQSDDVGSDYNVAVGTITDLADVPSGVTDVINIVPFTGAEDPEDIETFRTELLNRTRNPGSGAARDLISAVTAIEGIDSAAVFKNVDLAGAPALGTVSIRISGPGGTIPSGDLVAAALTAAEDADLANVTILVGTFDALDVSVTVHVAVSTGYTLDDVTPSVTSAITDYINTVPVGGTVYTAGLYAAIFGLPGVDDVVVNLPAAPGTTATNTQKPVVGVITVDAA